ncbi:MAG: MFS transporter [Deltaproteobacteria bacterium]|nr:MFS transporter [Deltaproteobacteria bacterium]
MIKKIFYGWWIVLACSLIGFYVGGAIFYGFTAFFEPIREEFGWSYTQISFAASLRGLEMGIFAPLVGFLADRFGSRKLIFWGTITVGFGLILLSRTQSLAMFYGSFLLIAFGAGGCAMVVTMAAVANWFHKNVGIALGMMASGVGASGLMVPFIVQLIGVYDWRTTLIILGLGMWILGIPLSFVIRNRPEQYGYLPDGISPSDRMPHLENQHTGVKAVEIGFKEALKKRAFLYLIIVEAIRMMIVAAVVIHAMPYLSSLGLPRVTAGLVAGAIPLTSIIGRFGFGWLSDVFDKRYVMAWSFCMISLGMLAFRYVQVIWVVFVFLLLFSPGYGGGMVLRGAILRGYFGRNSFGKMIGITMGSASIGGIIGPTLAGWAFDTFGSYRFIWLIFCGLSSLAIYLALKIKRDIGSETI